MKTIEQDFSIINCKSCGKTCKRILAGRYSNGKDKRWVDEQGKEFNGHRCPACHLDQVKDRKKKRANSQRSL